MPPDENFMLWLVLKQRKKKKSKKKLFIRSEHLDLALQGVQPSLFFFFFLQEKYRTRGWLQVSQSIVGDWNYAAFTVNINLAHRFCPHGVALPLRWRLMHARGQRAEKKREKGRRKRREEEEIFASSDAYSRETSHVCEFERGLKAGVCNR